MYVACSFLVSNGFHCTNLPLSCQLPVVTLPVQSVESIIKITLTDQLNNQIDSLNTEQCLLIVLLKAQICFISFSHMYIDIRLS